MNLENFEENDFSLFDISIVKKEVSGGKTEEKEIDYIAKYPKAKSLIISGLDQKSFEYLIKRYGSQFETISFWKNRFISDLSPLGNLTQLKYVHFFFNQRVSNLWNMEQNINLKGLGIYNFSKLHSIEGIATAPHLEYFSLGDHVWSKMEIESLRPLTDSSVLHFGWWGKKVLDNDYMCLANSHINELDISVRHFTMDELARLVASIPNLRGTITMPFYECSVIEQGENEKTFYFLCKGRKRLVKGEDDEKLKKYLSDYNRLLEQYRIQQSSE